MKGIFKPGPILGTMLLVFVSLGVARGQCNVPSGFICITQTQANEMAQRLDELTEARKVIEAFKNERVITDREREAFKSFMAVSENALNVLQKGIADRDALIALQQKTIELYAVLVEKLQAALNKPKSGWQKFIGAVEKVLILAAGVAIGRGGI